MIRSTTKRTVIAGLMLALGILLPYSTSHAYGISGSVLLPMHIPVLLCGFFCGPLYGGLCGFILPFLNSVLTGMPAMFPMAPIMMGELLTYGAVTGLIYNYSRRHDLKIICISLIAAMICGRIVYGLIANILFLANDMKKVSVIAAVVQGIPGIIIQLILVPFVVLRVSKNLMENDSTFNDAIALINNKSATCVVVKNGKIVSAESPKGIAHVINLYEKGFLKDAYVADTIIGKAAAMIFTLAGVKGCYGETMSKAGLKWLEEHGIKASYSMCTDIIENRTGDGMCPMESTVMDLNDDAEALTKLKAKVAELSAKKVRSE